MTAACSCSSARRACAMPSIPATLGPCAAREVSAAAASVDRVRLAAGMRVRMRSALRLRKSWKASSCAGVRTECTDAPSAAAASALWAMAARRRRFATTASRIAAMLAAPVLCSSARRLSLPASLSHSSLARMPQRSGRSVSGAAGRADTLPDAIPAKAGEASKAASARALAASAPATRWSDVEKNSGPCSAMYASTRRWWGMAVAALCSSAKSMSARRSDPARLNRSRKRAGSAAAAADAVCLRRCFEWSAAPALDPLAA
mmetsp:Transcript_16229/g.61518  ORF Transcript_16229/g.61518 Transcript_16229/m.61518 type:complete len:261 (+) Transcript_16229:234-1016(+)